MRFDRLRLFISIVATFIAVPFCPTSLSAIVPEFDLDQAKKAFRIGKYDEVISRFLKATGVERQNGGLVASQVYTLTGQYDEAENILREIFKKHPNNAEIRCRLAEILTSTGRSDEAIQLLAAVIENPSSNNRCLVQYGKLLNLRGRYPEAEPYFERALANYNEGIISNGEDIAMAAVASWALESYRDANRLFREALQVDPRNIEIQVLWGDLFLEKYNTAEARISYGKALEQNPRYVPALVGMAKTSSGHEAEKILQNALEINPNDISALEALAASSIEDDYFGSAEGYLNKIISVNPESLNAKTLLAAIAYLRDDQETYENIRKSVEAFSPGNAWFYSRIAEICGRKYRFTEAVALLRQAISIDPNHWNGHAVLGVNLLRLGKEEEGRARLEHSFEQDPFNFWTLNMLKVLDTLDGFETRKTGNFVVRLEKGDADVLWPYLKPLLEESWNTLTLKYGFTPKGPILIEVFNKHEDFSVRTSGLPDIGPLVGVCFGNVITLDSPKAFNPPMSLNWQEILWHEFTHVITLQMTRNRMPRWLSEGISVFEENQGRPEWGRKQDLELIKAAKENRLLPLTQLNEGFSRARTNADISFAYYQSSLVVEYIVEHYGFHTLKKLIHEYADHSDMEIIFKKVFDESTASVESEFLGWVNERIRSLNIYVHREEANDSSGSQNSGRFISTDTAESLKKRIEKNPRDFLAYFHLGMLHYKRNEFDEAVKYLAIARDLIPGYAANPNPHRILADIYHQQGRREAMIRSLEDLVSYQQHAFEACFKVAKSAYEQKNYEKAAYYLNRAIAVNPYHIETHKLFADIAMETADFDSAVREYEVLLALDATDPVRAHTDLADAFIRSGNRSKAKESALAALEIAPTFERAQTILLESLEQ